MSQELKETLDSFVNTMDEMMFEPDIDIDKLAPELIARYCELKNVLAREAVERLRSYLSAN